MVTRNTRASGKSKKTPDCNDQDVLKSAILRGVKGVSLRDYRPPVPEKVMIPGVRTLMYETDMALITEFVGKASRRFSPEGCICFDIGTYGGSSAIMMAQAGHFKVLTVDPNPKFREGRHSPFKFHGVEDTVEFRQMKSEDVVFDRDTKIVFMLLDGNHHLPQVFFEFLYFGQYVPVGGFIAVHDVGKHKWPGMARVVDEAVESGKWKVVGLEGYMCVLERKPDEG